MTIPKGDSGLGKRLPKWLETIISVAVASAVFLGASEVAMLVNNSTLLRQSRIFRNLLEQEDSVDIMQIVKSKNIRKAAEKFTAALTNAYVSFEMIPYDQGKTFTAIMSSLNDGIEVELFEYHGRDLLIVGKSDNMENYESFSLGLSSSGIFENVVKMHTELPDGEIEFSITCFSQTPETYTRFFGRNDEDRENKRKS